jgi:hypothetical protein
MTRAELQARLDAYLAAELKILRGQEYVIGQGETARRLRRADLAEVRDEISKLAEQITALDNAAAGTRRVLYTRPMN